VLLLLLLLLLLSLLLPLWQPGCRWLLLLLLLPVLRLLHGRLLWRCQRYWEVQLL
jgi:hypothetical protein